MFGFAVLNDEALMDLADVIERGAPFTEADYEAVFNEMDARGLLTI